MPVFQRRRSDGKRQWHYRKMVRLPDGRKKRVSGTPSRNTRLAAERAERDAIDLLINPRPVEVEAVARPFRDVARDFMRDHATVRNAPSEVYSKERILETYLLPELGDLDVAEIRTPQVMELTASLGRRTSRRGGALSAKTVNNALQVLGKILRWAKRKEWLTEVPEIDKLRVKSPAIRFLDQTELEALVEAARPEPQWLAAILLGADAGLRFGEIRALQWDAYATTTNRLRVTRSLWGDTLGPPKSGKDRMVPPTVRLAAALKAIRGSKLRGPYVLAADDGEPLSLETMRWNLPRLCRKAGIEEIGWHALRHTFCSHLAMRGVPVLAIKELAGHASITTTMRYMHLAAGEIDRAIAALEDPAWHERGTAEREEEKEPATGEDCGFFGATPTGRVRITSKIPFETLLLRRPDP
jgi:integrase